MTHVRVHPLVRCATLATLGALGACSDGPGPGHGTFVNTSGDAGEHDDAGRDADGERGDAGEHAVVADDTHLCSYGDADRLVIATRLRADVLSSAANARGAALAFQRIDGALVLASVPNRGDAPAAVAVAAAADRAGAPALAANNLQLLLGYRSARNAGDALIVRVVSDPAAAPVTLSRSLSARTDHGESFALAGTPQGFVAAFLDDEGAHLQGLTETAAVSGNATALDFDAAQRPLGLALARFATGGFVLAFPAPSPAGDVHLFGRTFGTALSPASAPWQLTKHPIEGSAWSLAARGDSAGLLYPALDGGVRAALKLRRIDTTGAPEGPVLNVKNAPRLVDAGSIAAFGRGYAVAYRELPSLGRPGAALRIAFVNPFGSVVYDAELAPLDASASAGKTSVAAADGAALLVSWTEPGEGGATLRALRLRCPGALVLCGGSVD